MKTLQQQINEQIEFCEKVLSENTAVNYISVNIKDAEPDDIGAAQLTNKIFGADIDSTKDRDGDKIRLHLRNGDWSIFVYSVPVKITTSVKYEAI